ncbi:PREDICTED: phosphatidylinositol N-acetylglucosaminyltransferase subunit H-like [Diuraphis noxia]|uniref:phosphatidylinositol N-acetylglucosaminyltransferase subunit H-like n=1 Tax=Diuraphis noxia TaxID=143948 RepID=UPI0007635D49|nr:PREDICTED: phosphatidylinositol N-acetylglucosaminyltransferase subunit H-like [Diuraphis noxia]
MNIIMSDNRLVLKSSVQESLKHSCIEYCVEKREKCSNTEYLIIMMSLLLAAYSYLINPTVLISKTVFIIAIVLFIIGLRFSFKVYNESLLITAPIGLQLTTTYMTGHQRVFSIPWHSITDVLIVDVIHTQQVLYYLAIKTPQNGIVTLFQKSAPRLHFLEIIYKDVYKLLENNR